MSLLPSVTAGNSNQYYYIENIGGSGATNVEVPCLAGTPFGTVRVGNATNGLILNGQTSGAANIRGGGATSAAGSFLILGASTAQPAQITLSDAIVTIAAPLAVSGAGNDLTVADDVNIGGDIILNGTGGSISGYYNATTPSASYADSTDTPIANPAGLTEGWYIVAAQTGVGGQQEQQVNVIVHRSAASLWDIGGTVRSVAGAGTFGFKPSADRTTMVVQNSTGAAQTATIYWAKLLN